MIYAKRGTQGFQTWHVCTTVLMLFIILFMFISDFTVITFKVNGMTAEEIGNRQEGHGFLDLYYYLLHQDIF